MILVVFGTRPEALKLSECVRLAKSRGLPVHVHCTMQSPDLVDKAILPWDSDTSDGFPPIGFAKLVVVQGDTRTAFYMALKAYEEGIPVFHLEAGVRTYDLASPWPEEGYRQMISRIATYHACTTDTCWNNLWRESYPKWKYNDDITAIGNARVTGSPIVESVRERAEVALTKTPAVPYVVVTLHRRENRGHFADILNGVSDAIGLEIAYSWFAHPNGWAVQECDNGMNHHPPLNAVDFAAVLRDAACVVTDSGGCQEEASALGTPCVVAREKTDRPESLGKGGAILAGTTRKGVRNAILQHALKMDRSTIDRTIFGDGTASEKIVDWLAEIVGQR